MPEKKTNPEFSYRRVDKIHNLTFTVTAYRKLSEAEILENIQDWFRQPGIRKLKKHPRNMAIVIPTLLGLK